jgi:hypothetical protein
MSDEALKLVGQIITAYNAAEKAGTTALTSALECGKHLSAANKSVTAAKGKWKAWREQHLPTVSEETERVYRRLADAVGKQENIFAKCKSIRDAIKHLSRFDEDLNLKPEPVRKPKQPKAGSSAAGLTPPEPDTPSGGSGDLTGALVEAEPDEVVIALIDAKWDTDKVQKLVSLLQAKLQAQAQAALKAKVEAQAQTQQPSSPPPHRRSAGEILGLRQPS